MYYRKQQQSRKKDSQKEKENGFGWTRTPEIQVEQTTVGDQRTTCGLQYFGTVQDHPNNKWNICRGGNIPSPPWTLTTSHLNTASFYYLLDLSSFSVLSIHFLYFRFVTCFCFFSSFFVVPSLYVKPTANNSYLGFFPSAADTQPRAGPPVQTIPFSVWMSVWLTWPSTAVSLVSLQPHVPRIWNNY